MKTTAQKSSESQLNTFIDKYTPGVGAVARAAIAKMRARVPGALLLVYDNYNALAIGFGPTERASDIIFSIALYPRWVSLFFMDGVNLPDPHRLLKGSGKGIRHIVLEDAAALDKPEVRALLTHALERKDRSLKNSEAGRIVIKSISAKQRPRRPVERAPCVK